MRSAPVATPTVPTFVDDVQHSRIRFRHNNGSSGRYYYPEIIGPGCGLIDFDNDGWLDLFLVQGGPLPGWKGNEPLTNSLYRNNRDGTFTDVTEAAGVSGIVNGRKTYGIGCAVADFDSDGFDDLLVTNYGRPILYRNRGNGTFEDVTERMGLTREGFWTSAAFFDYDGDGRLDLFLCNYIRYRPGDDVACGESGERRDYCPPGFFPPSQSALYHNEGSRFRDVTAAAKITSPFNKALGVIAGDFNEDGKPDLYVACDLTPKLLYINRGDGTFSEEALERGLAVSESGGAQASMGLDFRDYDGDRKPDVLVTNYWFENNNLYQNLGSGHFVDRGMSVGLNPRMDRVSWGAALRDFNNDGRLDCFVANGHVLLHPEGTTPGASAKQTYQLFLNLGGGRFREVSSQAGRCFQEKHLARGAAFGDLNNDGRLDIVVAHINEAPSILINQCSAAANWLQLKLIGTKSNRSAIGARVLATVNGKTLVDEVRSAYSYASANDLRVHFGLGTATSTRIEILWPSGTRQTIDSVKTNQIITVKEPS